MSAVIEKQDDYEAAIGAICKYRGGDDPWCQPYCVESIDNYVIVSWLSSDNEQIRLEIYTKEEVLIWHKIALDFLSDEEVFEDDDVYTIVDAMADAEPCKRFCEKCYELNEIRVYRSNMCQDCLLDWVNEKLNGEIA